MGDSIGGNGGEGTSGSKSFETNSDGFLGSSLDWESSQPLSQSETFQPHLFTDADHVSSVFFFLRFSTVTC